MSLRWSTSSFRPAATSGALYEGVPMIAPARVCGLGLAHHLGDAPVEQDRLAVGAEHHVLGLQVAVQDAVAVRVGDRLAEREEDLEQAEVLDVVGAPPGPRVMVLDDLLEGP